MRLHRAFPTLLVAALLTAGAAGCGVEANDDAGGPVPTLSVPKPPDPPTTTSEPKGSGTGGSTGTLPKRPTTTTSGPDRTTTTTTTSSGPSTTPGIDNFDFRDTLIDTYEDLGLTEDQAACLTDGIIDSGAVDPSSPNAEDLDFSKISDVLVECGISPNDFGDGIGD